MVKAIIFDCFGVLCVDPGLYFYDHMVSNHEAIYDELLAIDRQVDIGLITIKQHDQMVAQLTGLSVETVTSNIRSGAKRHDKMIDLMNSLHANYKIGMLSNIGRGGMRVFFSDEEQAQLFDAVVLSSDMGVAKPDPTAFRAIASKLGVDPEECVMIDDREDNCHGAEAVGMRSVVYKNFTQCKRALQAILE